MCEAWGTEEDRRRRSADGKKRETRMVSEAGREVVVLLHFVRARASLRWPRFFVVERVQVGRLVGPLAAQQGP